MKKKLMSLLLALTTTVVTLGQSLTATAPNGVFTASDIQYWVGSGPNEVGVVLIYNNPAQEQALCFGYRWYGSGSISYKEIFDSVMAQDARFAYDALDYFLNDVTIDMDLDGTPEYSLYYGQSIWFMLKVDNQVTGSWATDCISGNHWVGIEAVEPDYDMSTATYTPLQGLYVDTTCHAPTDIYVDSIEQTSVMVHWKDTISHKESFYLYYKSSSDTVYDSIHVTDTVYIIDNLLPSTKYMYYLRSDCEDSNSKATQIYTFRTACGEEDNLPYTENFDSYQLNTFPACWHTLSLHNYSKVTNEQRHSGTSSFIMDKYANELLYITTPKFADDINIEDLSISFWLKRASISVYEGQFHTYPDINLYVGVMSNPNDSSTFVCVDTILIERSVWKHKQVHFNNYSGQGKYIAFRVGDYNRDASFYLDDVQINYTSSCEGVNHLKAKANEQDPTSSIDISFDDVSATNNYTVYYKPVNTVNLDSVQITNNEYTLTNLSSGTKYIITIATNCTNGKVYSFDTVTVLTTCLPALLPITQNFDNIANMEDLTCWKVLSSSTDYPVIDVTSHALSSPNALMFYGNYQEIVAFPTFDTNVYPISSLHLKGYFYSTNNTLGLTIGFMSDVNDASTFDSLTTVLPSNSSRVKRFDIPFNNYTGNKSIVAIRRNKSSNSYLYLDDLTLEVMPNCLAPSDVYGDSITDSSIVIHYTCLTDDANMRLYYKNISSASWDSLDITNNSSYLLSGLSQATSYQCLLATVCEDTILMAFDTVSFTTKLTPVALGFEDDFSDTNKVWLLNNGNFVNRWYKGQIGTTDTNALFVSSDGQEVKYMVNRSSLVCAEKTFLISPTEDSVRIQFDVTVGGESSYDYLKVFFADDSTQFPVGSTTANYGNRYTSTNCLKINNNYYLNKQRSHIDVTVKNPASNGLAKIVFVWRNDSSGGDSSAVSIRNLSIKYLWDTIDCTQKDTIINSQICQNTTYSFNGRTLNQTGIYIDTLTNELGCDSIVTLHLTVNPTYDTIINATICHGESYSFLNNNYTQAGTYVDTLISEMGCDSVVTLHLTVNPTYDTAIYDTINQGDTLLFNELAYTQAGTYPLVLSSINGCDSTVTLYLSVSSVPDTTQGLEEYTLDKIHIYPNPTKSNVVIDLSSITANIDIYLYDASGKMIKSYDNIHGLQLFDIDLSSLPSGTYYLSMKSPSFFKQTKIIKQ